MFPPHFYAEFHGPRRLTEAEAVADYDAIVALLRAHRPDLLPEALRPEKVACKGVGYGEIG